MKLSEEKIKAGWQIVRFGDVAKEVNLTTSNPAADGLEFYVGLEHLDPQSLRLQRKGVITEDNPTFTRLFKPGQILFGKRRAYQKKAAVADFAGICSGDILVMEAKPGKILPGLLPFIVQSDLFFDHAVKTSSGSLSPRTKWKSLAEFEFPLPPPARQKAILEVLEKVEECWVKYVDLKSKIDETLIITLNELFSEQSANFDKLERVADVIAGKNAAIDKALSSGVKMVTLPCVNQYCEFSVHEEDIAYIAPEFVAQKDYLRANDILFNWRNGSPDHVGKTAFIEEDMDYVHVGFLLRIKPKTREISSRYLYWYLRHLKSTGFFFGAKQQVNRTFNKGELLELDVARYDSAVENKIEAVLQQLYNQQKLVERRVINFSILRKSISALVLGGYDEYEAGISHM